MRVKNNLKKFKKLTLFDLAAARIKNSRSAAEVKKGDLIEILSPFSEGENYFGIVIRVDSEYMHVYHSDVKQVVSWNRNVKCKVSCL